MPFDNSSSRPSLPPLNIKKLFLFRVPLQFVATEGTLTHYTCTVLTVKFLYQATDAEILLGKSKFLEEKAALFNPPGSKTVVIPKSARCQCCRLQLGFVITVLLSDPDPLFFLLQKLRCPLSHLDVSDLFLVKPWQ